MGRIPQQTIDQILQQTDIVDLISASVELKRAGSNFKACCPFHNEKTASFMVSPHKQIYHCFGCHVGGNALSFLMAHDQLDFLEAIKKLAEPLNIQIESSSSGKESQRDLMLKVNAYAQWFFKSEYQRSDKARTYVQGRHLSDEVVEKFELGFAPDSYEALLPYLLEKKIPEELSIKLGLIKKGQEGRSYDFFRDRLMFPIRNFKGEIVGFGGRSLSEKQAAKYINSAESPVYNKSRELYGLFQAKKAAARDRQIVVVEGYIDVLSCVQLGIENVVAPLGTSLTAEHIKIIKKYADEVILMFDGDEAGKKAAVKAIQTCLSTGFHPRVVALTGGQDPGDYLSKNSNNNELRDSVDGAVFAMDWLFSGYVGRATAQPTERARALQSLLQWIERLPDRFERHEYKNKVAQFFEIPLGKIEKKLEFTNNKDMLHHPKTKEMTIEGRLVLLYARHFKQFPGQSIKELSQDFEDLRLKEIAENLQDFVKKHETFEVARAIQVLPDELKGIFSSLMISEGEGQDGDQTGVVRDCIQKFQRQASRRKLKDITAKILQAELNKNHELKFELLKQKQVLLTNAARTQA